MRNTAEAELAVEARSRSAFSRLPFIVFLVAAFGVVADAAKAADLLVLDQTIPLQNVTGRIDHMAVDLARKRLFVAELGNGTLDVIDLAAGSAVRRVDGLKEPQGVGYAPGADVVAVANARDGSVHLFRGADLSPVGEVNLGDDADNVRLDPRTGNFVVGYGNGGLAVIDPAKASLVGRIPLQAHPEGFQLDSSNGRAVVNVPDAREIAVVDMRAGRQATNWRLPNFRANFPMAIDPDGRVIAVVFRSPARLVTFDANGGNQTGSIATCNDADDVFFDSKRHRIYVSCGDGSVDVFQNDSGQYHRVSVVKSASGAACGGTPDGGNRRWLCGDQRLLAADERRVHRHYESDIRRRQRVFAVGANGACEDGRPAPANQGIRVLQSGVRWLERWVCSRHRSPI
jgi:DNA-binding beta-propeller fold protein YncE